jgi:hypothetical protein
MQKCEEDIEDSQSNVTPYKSGIVESVTKESDCFISLEHRKQK